MPSRIRLSIVGALTIVAAVSQVQRTIASEDLWRGAAGSDWNVAASWAAYPSNTAFVPQDGGGFHLRGIIGSDQTPGLLAGSAVINAQLPGLKATIAGLALGVRNLDYTVTPPAFLNPAPAAGTLTGSLTVHAGTLTNVTSTSAGADGRILVGVDGRGYLTMDGGTLVGTGLVVAGENNTSGAGTSLLDLSGNAAMSISGSASFQRRVNVTGPSLTFNSTGQLRLESANTLTANITSATAHSPLTTANNAIVSGSLVVNFSGAAAARDPIASLGQTWDLVKSTLSTNAIAGNFSNLSSSGDVAVTGLDAAHSAPIGAAYRIHKAVSGASSVLQLSYDKILILTVNRDTGQMTVRNPYAGNIGIDGYTINSSLGSMVTGYAGLGTTTPGAGTWSKPVDGSSVPLNTANVLSEVKDPDFTPPNVNNDVYDLTSVPSVSLGNGFSRTAVAGNIANFGTSGEDLSFDYTSPSGGIVRGAVEYVGNKFFNNLVLRVNPTTGQAFLKNDSQVTLKFDGYSVLSSTAALNGAGFTGLGGSWLNANNTAGALTQTNLSASTTLAPGASLPIGTIGNFTTAAAQAGLSLQFILSSNLPLPGDYNNNGQVDAADYTVWRDHLGQTFPLPNEGFGQTPGTVTAEDYNLWRANFGANSTLAFRTGSIFFDATAGAGSLSGVSIPEPNTKIILALGLVGIVLVAHGRSRSRARQLPCNATQTHSDFDQTGTNNMSQRFGFCTAALCVLTSLLTAATASAAPGGILLTNGDFELPGPAGTKVIAFDPPTGNPIPGIIPGWAFSGPGTETFGHDGTGTPPSTLIKGDSGTEGNGAGLVGNELLLSMLDGTVSQTSTTNLVALPTTQKYRLSFDAHDIFTIYGTIPNTSQYTSPLTSPIQLTARLYYGAAKTTLLSLPINLTGTRTNYNLEIPGGSPLLTGPAIGQPLGVEFDTTTLERSQALHTADPTFPVASHSWAGVDNVLLQIAPVLTGDLNGDGVVNGSGANNDYDVLRANMQTNSPYIANGDLNGDGVVNLNDFRVFRTLLGTGSGSGAGSLAGGSVPEPSSWALLLIMGATISGAFVRKQLSELCRIRSLLWSVFAAAIALTTTTSSFAVVLYYDPFNIGANPAAGQYALGQLDTTAAAGDGQNPTIGPTNFFSGAWQIRTSDGNAPYDNVVATGLSYLGSPASGGSIQPVVHTNADTSTTADSRAGRNLTNPWTATTTSTLMPDQVTANPSGAYYLSFLASFGTVANPNTTNAPDLGFRTVEFWPTSGQGVGDDSGRSEIGYNGFFNSLGASQQLPQTAKLDFITPGGGTQILTDTTFNQDNGSTHLIVMKFVLSATAASDSISVFLDPTDNVEPIVPSAVATGLDFTLKAMDSITYFGTPTGTLPAFDELRVGTTYADALPVFPTKGDTNGDMKVDILDYQAIIHHMNLTGQSAANGDVTGDGKVTIADYRLWKDHRTDIPSGSGAGALGGTNVPEPSTALLVLTAALPLLGFARRRR